MNKKTAAKKKSASRKKSTTSSHNRHSINKENKKPKITGTCFVMMPFRDPFNNYYEMIFKPAITRANLISVRADDLFRPGVIVSDLWQMIQDATVLVAELTTKNANVFYELGLAHAIGKPVILVSETEDDIPFDLQQLRVILYNKDDPAWGKILADAITKAITETLYQSAEAVPSIFRKTVESHAPKQHATIARIDSLESQVRMIRARIEQSERNPNPWEKELNEVDDEESLAKWATRWHKERKIPIDILQDAITNATQIPSLEADKIMELIQE